MKKIGILGNYFRPERAGSPSAFGAYYLNKDYMDCFQNHAVLPLYLTYQTEESRMEAFVDLIDGLVLTGGFDIPPAFYNQTEIPGNLCTIDLARAQFELKLLSLAQKKDIPVLGICLGMQIFNVFRGGSLIQDIATQKPGSLNHRASCLDGRVLAHEVNIHPNTRLSEILGVTQLATNSSHHQAIDQLGQNLRVAASTADGIIEAIECTKTRFIGVQWHPEGIQVMQKQRSIIDWFVCQL